MTQRMLDFFGNPIHLGSLVLTQSFSYGIVLDITPQRLRVYTADRICVFPGGVESGHVMVSGDVPFASVAELRLLDFMEYAHDELKQIVGDIEDYSRRKTLTTALESLYTKRGQKW
ncbi:hypothetical protein EniLVp02_0081 [Vibrio phage EniLVp02]